MPTPARGVPLRRYGVLAGVHEEVVFQAADVSACRHPNCAPSPTLRAVLLWQAGGMEADYVIVGAGAAGCVLAERLSRRATVVLVENGGPARNPVLSIPKAFYWSMRSPTYAYHYPVVVDGRPEGWVRGKGLGGSTLINGMLYLRGDPADYDALAARGNPGWDWAHMGSAFAALEDLVGGAARGRGGSGPLPSSVTPIDEPVSAAMVTAAERQGIRAVADLHAVAGERIAPAPTMIRAGRRVDAAHAFLRPARSRGTLTVLTRARAGFVILDGTRAVGVRVAHRDSLLDVRARREVIVAAGTIESPMLLERSGIGEPDRLAAVGVVPRVESPHLGERVVEQRAVTMKARLHPGLGLGPRLNRIDKRFAAGVRYFLTRTGPVATGAYELAAVVAAGARAAAGVDHGDARPDTQLLLSSLATDDTGLAVADYAGLMIQGYVLRPTTTSSVHISGLDPEAPPRIVARYLGSDDERRTGAAILGVARRLLETEPLAGLVEAETVPGPGVASADDVARYALTTGTGIYHAVGSCAMGPGDDDVLDPRLRVRGVTGLRVVDGSVFPEPPAGGLAAPVMAAAWRAADLLLEEAG